MSLPSFWVHIENCLGDSKKERDLAIERMFDYYDAHPGRRRLPAREAMEVYRSRFQSGAGWVLYVRRRKRTVHHNGPGREGDGKPLSSILLEPQIVKSSSHLAVPAAGPRPVFTLTPSNTPRPSGVPESKAGMSSEPCDIPPGRDPDRAPGEPEGDDKEE